MNVPPSVARQVEGRGEIAIRAAGPDDADSVRQLALLTDRPAPTGQVLVAESDGAIVAALSTVSGAVVSDPFRATGDLIELLRLRSAQLHRLAA
jgi:hypothetical protein